MGFALGEKAGFALIAALLMTEGKMVERYYLYDVTMGRIYRRARIGKR